MNTHEMTIAEATDEALRMFRCRTRRHTTPEVFAKILGSLSREIRETITMAENRANTLNDEMAKVDLKAKWPTYLEETEEDDENED